ncbi:MAG: glycosyltransferase family 4 protein, partial [Chloroflexales bacterium]|nr:glycosyltransferase family 4 protein [Chloroflexales bacterium]
MKILLLSGEYPPQPGGIGDYTRRLAESLAARGHALHVATIHNGRFVVYDLGNADLESKIQNPKSNWGWRSHRHVAAALRALRPDVLHIQYQTGAYAMRPAINLLPWRLARLRQRPHVAVTFHDLLEPYLFPKAGPARRWVTLRLARDADAVVCTNDADAARLASCGTAPVVIPIGSNIALNPPPGYERAAWRAQLGASADEPLVAYFGLLSHSKGLDVLLDTLFGPQAHPALARARL